MSHDLNISNYESWFLSYIDGELTEAEVEVLQQFLLKYPHLQQELDLLEGVKIVPDTSVTFDNKSVLYKNTATADISEEEQALMLSYLDGELAGAELDSVKQYLGNNPAAAKEFEIFSRTKLVPDTSIVFPDKASLYRHMRKPGVIYRRIGWSAAAAAVVAGLIFWLLPAPQPGIAPEGSKAIAVVDSPVPATAKPVEEEVASPAPALADASAPKQKAPVAAPVKNVKEKVAKQATMPVSNQATAAVISQMPPQRNSVEEVVTQHLQDVASAAADPGVTEVKKEAVLAVNTPISAKNNIDDNKSAVIETPQSPPGELIISVSGSDSKILDKVTNVAKLFSRKRK